MEEKLKQIIRENRWKFLNHESHENYDRFNTVCVLIPSDEKGTSFSLKIMCGGSNSENEEVEPLFLYVELMDYSIGEFKSFLYNCSKKYAGQIEIYVPVFLSILYALDDNPTAEDAIELIDELVFDKDWSLAKSGIGFIIVDRTM